MVTAKYRKTVTVSVTAVLKDDFSTHNLHMTHYQNQ